MRSRITTAPRARKSLPSSRPFSKWRAIPSAPSSTFSARRAAQMFAHEEAIALSRRALGLLERLPQSPERDRRELDLLMTLGPQLSLLRGFGAAEVEEIFRRARELCLRIEDGKRRVYDFR